ncbi:MAG: VWA domain-containing protein [Treponema sp.]|nr:VWA domain-containing protein [Treponema sp.]
MSFDHPRLLFALFLLIPVALTGFFHYRKRRSVLGFLSRDAGGSLVSNIRFRYLVSSVGFFLFLACLIVALAQPRGGSRLASETRRGVDVIFAVDLSRSMDVRDAGGLSRLGRAAALLTELVDHPRFAGQGASGIRFGAAIGKGRAALALPLTEDAEAIGGFLTGLSGAAITGRGTNLESLVDAAAAAFQDAFPSRRRIVLLSDGEALTGALNAAADRASAAEIALIAVGLGSGEGGLVPLGNDALSGDNGRPVVSSLRIDALKEAAERTGGFYVDGNRGAAASQLADHLSSLAFGGSPLSDEGVAAGSFRREDRPVAHIFIIAALIAMGIAKLMEKGGRKGG